MELSLSTGKPEQEKTATLVVGVFSGQHLAGMGGALPMATRNALVELLQSGDMEDKTGSLLLLRSVPGVAASRILLVHLGKENELNETSWRKATRAALKTLVTLGGTDAVLTLTQVPVPGRDVAWCVKQAVLLAEEATYRFALGSGKQRKKEAKITLTRIVFALAAREREAAQAALTEAQAMASGMRLMRNLANQPPNVCHPQFLANEAQALAKKYKKLSAEILDERALKKLGMNTLLAVAQGSQQPPRLIILKYQGAGKNVSPVVLVGKGVTFDSGGISLKPSAEMDEMKFDMSGAASVMGAIKAVAELELDINVVAVAAAVENMPGGKATRPGDIVVSMSGQTVEILNTDAEGRLILCDALTYVERFDPACVVDVATLTGACVVALGNAVSGLLANHQPLSAALAAAGETAWDRAWPLPLLEEYQELLHSNFADVPNISGGRGPGAITAACFLSRFTKKYHWAHLDIAGTAYRSGKEKGSTGRPVPLLVQFLLDYARSKAAA